MQFVKRVWILSLFLTLCSWAARLTAADTQEAFKTVGVDEFDKLRADKASVVLDVRTKREFTSGHIKGAVNIDWNGTDFAKQADALDKTKVYLVHCAVGGRSARTAKKMSELGFTKVYNLQGGLSAWEKAGKPTEQ